MAENNVFPVPTEWAEKAKVDNTKYMEMYQHSIDDPEGFWGEHGKRVDWIKPYTQVKSVSYNQEDLHIKWFHDGTLNVSANCLDRHLESNSYYLGGR